MLSSSLVLVALLVGFAAVIRDNEAAERAALADGFETRATLTTSFTRRFVDELVARQRSQAQRLLADPEISEDDFGDVVQAFDFEAAVLLDDEGRVMQAWPLGSAPIGRDLAAEHPYLQTAVAGSVGVSEVVQTNARGVPVAAVAVPYESAVGRRVFSGAFSPSTTPLGGYLDAVVPVQSGTAYLVDQSGRVLAASLGARSTRDDLAELAVGISEFESDIGMVTAAVAEVPESPWRVVLLAPSDGLYAPVVADWAPWALWGAVAAAGCLVVVLFVRLSRARAHAATAARTDALTGLPNRRAMQEALIKATALSSRHNLPLAALMVDIDHFKNVNDTYGHEIGDLVIKAAAAGLIATTREEDHGGRWGGEEFLVVLPQTGYEGALAAAERVREAIAAADLPADAAGAALTVSVGVAVRHHDALTLLREADTALYLAKAKGRNRVEGTPPPAPNFHTADTGRA